MKVSIKHLFLITLTTTVGLQADDLIRFGDHISLKDYSQKYYSPTQGLSANIFGWELVNADPNNQPNPVVSSGNKVFLRDTNSGKYLSARNDDDHHVALADAPQDWEKWIINAGPGSTNQLTRQRQVWFTSAFGGRLHSEVGQAAGNVNANSGIAAKHTCGRFDIACKLTDFFTNNPVTHFIEDSAKQVGDFVKKNITDPINDKVVGPLLDKVHMIANGATMAANALAGLPGSITDQVAPVIGGSKRVCAQTSDMVCPTSQYCVEVKTVPLDQQMKDAGTLLFNTIQTIQSSIADVKAQKQSVIAQKLDKKPITELKQLNTILVGPNGAFDQLEDALNAVIGQQGLEGLRQAFETAKTQAVAGQNDIKQKINDLRNAIDHPTTNGIPLSESLPSRFNHIASAFQW